MNTPSYHYVTRKTRAIKWSTIAAFFVGFILALAPFSSMGATPLDSKARPKDVIYDVVRAQDTQQWQDIPGFWIDSERVGIAAFLANPEYRVNRVGYFNMRSARIAEIKELPAEAAREVTDYDAYAVQYGAVKVFYVGIDYTVRQEDRNHYNGVNYRLVVLVPQNREWNVAEMSEAPVDVLTDLGYGFKSKTEQDALKIKRARYQGLYINLVGKVIDKNMADVAALRKRRDSQPLDAGVETATANTPTPPSIIYVWLTKSVNLSYYQCSSQCLRGIPYDYYQKNTLPNEWTDAGLPADVYKAGAMAIKTFAWWRTLNKWDPARGADLTDTSMQFVRETARTETDNGVNGVASYGMVSQTTRRVVKAEFGTGYRTTGNYHTGLLWIKGTYYWIADKGWGYVSTLGYYYDLSNNAYGEYIAVTLL